MKFNQTQKGLIRAFFTRQRAKLVKLATGLQAGPPVHAVTRGEFERALETFVDSDPAFEDLSGIIMDRNLKEESNKDFMTPLINDVFRSVPAPRPAASSSSSSSSSTPVPAGSSAPPAPRPARLAPRPAEKIAPPPPAEPERVPQRLETGGILCEARNASMIGRCSGLSPGNALKAAQCGSVDGEAYPQFTTGVSMYHSTVDSADGREGEPDRKHSGKKKITFFYEQVGGRFYFVAAGVHTSMRTYRVTHVVAPKEKPGNLKVGDAIGFHAPAPAPSPAPAEDSTAVVAQKAKK